MYYLVLRHYHKCAHKLLQADLNKLILTLLELLVVSFQSIAGITVCDLHVGIPTGTQLRSTFFLSTPSSDTDIAHLQRNGSTSCEVWTAIAEQWLP